jgi:hypothetical protein
MKIRTETSKNTYNAVLGWDNKAPQGDVRGVRPTLEK